MRFLLVAALFVLWAPARALAHEHAHDAEHGGRDCGCDCRHGDHAQHHGASAKHMTKEKESAAKASAQTGDEKAPKASEEAKPSPK